MTQVRIAAAQYPIERISSFAEWKDKLTRWVAMAADQDATIAVFPEYAAMELAGVEPVNAGSLSASLETVIKLGQDYDAVHAELSKRFGVMILSGSRPLRRGNGDIVNRSHLYCPDGQTGHQDKIMMTRFERETWGIAGGTKINVIPTPIGKIGISICYDVEFPMIARSQAQAGARLILAPSATDSMHGYWRVRLGAQARALENQCFVVQSPTVGIAEWLPCMDENHGAAGIFGPPDDFMPEDGVLKLGNVDEASWVIADIDLDMSDRWRREGSVLPFRDWPEQHVPCGEGD